MSKLSGLVRRLSRVVLVVSIGSAAALAAAPNRPDEANLLESRPLFSREARLSLAELPHTSSPAAVRERAVAIDFSALDPALGAIEIDSFDGRSWMVEKSSIELRGAGDYTWRGLIRDEAGRDGQATISVKNGHLAGTVWTPLGEVLSIRPTANGLYLLSDIDQRLFNENEDLPRRPPVESKVAGESVPVALADDGSTIDVMVIYTPAARDAAGGTNAIEAIAQNAVDITNTSYANSQINPRMRLVHTGLVNHTETSTFDSELNWVTNDTGVAALRDQYGADLVTMLISLNTYCGLGWLMTTVGSGFAPYAFNVDNWSCAADNITLGHECGHNQGANHNPEDAGGQGAYSYSYGHFVDGDYRTVMAYFNHCTNGCPKAPYFSNPSVSYHNQPTGIASARDNHLTLNNTASTVANFRQSNQAGGGGGGGGGPTAPSGLTVLKTGKTKVKLAWTDNSSDETAFKIAYWNGTDWTNLASVGANVVKVKVLGLQRQTAYTFAVFASNGSGDSAASNQVTTTTK